MGMLLRYLYEVRDSAEYFEDITKDMLDLAKHIVEQKASHFEPDKFEDRYEQALQELLDQKRKDRPIAAARKPAPSNVFNLMDALKHSIKGSSKPATGAKAQNTKKTAAAKSRRRASRSFLLSTGYPSPINRQRTMQHQR
ncbi:hypothetical protein [Bradyrhizobium elkanii]|uniref:hypothetical protein n=1 Tax=Bradyrhizobium elkanii TaxID=29448 RepID=UPI001BABBACB|nr:hypothetical protein [Bradyrhizobium elkanii]